MYGHFTCVTYVQCREQWNNYILGKPRRRHSRNIAWFMQHCAQYMIMIKAAVRASVFLHISTASVMTIPDHIRIVWRQSSVESSRVSSSLEQSRASSFEPRVANLIAQVFLFFLISSKSKFLEENIIGYFWKYKWSI